MKNAAQIIKAIYEKFIIEMDYNHPDGERHYGIVTRNPKYTNGIEPDEEENYIVYDLLTEKWIRASIIGDTGFNINCSYIKTEDGTPIKNPFLLQDINDEEVIEHANTSLLLKIKARQTAIDNVITEAKRFNIPVTEEEKNYYYSLYNTYWFSNYEDEMAYILAILLITKQPILKTLKDKPTKSELNIAIENWLNLINGHIEEGCLKLDKEKEELDKTAQEYEMEVEEIEVIKNLLRDIKDDSYSKLKSYKTYTDITSYWPPMLLPSYLNSAEIWNKLKSAVPREDVENYGS